MNTDYITISPQTYDVTIHCVQPNIQFIGLDQTEVLKFLSLMHKGELKYYSRDGVCMSAMISAHKDEYDGDNNE